ncbi:MAG: hypothetical protein IJD86_00795 [Clostridia bacterium]|nr:hypothetical protein [Clostridia bacterium]
MKNKSCFIHLSLMLTLTVTLIAITLVHTFLPQFLIPKATIPNLVLLSAVSCLIDHYVSKGAKRNYLLIAAFSFLSFFLLPYLSNYSALCESLKIALAGAAVFTLSVFLFTLAADRLSTGSKAVLSPVLTAAFLYLAAQCFEGMFF